MGSVNKWMSKIIKSKTTKSLTCASIIFKVTLVAVSIYLMFFVNEYNQMNKNFYNNKHTHIIEISKVNKDDTMQNLSIKDMEKVNKVLKESNCNKGVYVSNLYFINFGINASNNKTYYISALDDELYTKLGLDFKNNILAYHSEDSNKGMLCLQVPVIKEQFGGYSAVDYKNITLNVEKLNKEISEYLVPQKDTLYVSLTMYKNIVENMYDISYDAFLEKVNNGQDFGITDVSKILIYVENIGKVKDVAKLLEDDGYILSYTLNAFDNIVQSLNTTKILGFLLIICFLVITVANMLFSSEMYLNNSQKDMGILLHYGYNKKDVVKMYSYNFKMMMINTFGIVIVALALSGVIFIKSNLLQNIFIVIVITLLMLLAVYYLIRKKIQKRVNKNTLELLKFSKENE